MEITTRRRRALSTALALFLAVESVSAVAAVAVAGHDDAGTRHALPAAPPAGIVDAAQGAPAALAPLVASTRIRPAGEDPDSAGAGAIRTTTAPAAARTFAPRVAIASVNGPKPKHGSSGGASGGSASHGATTSASHK